MTNKRKLPIDTNTSILFGSLQFWTQTCIHVPAAWPELLLFSVPVGLETDPTMEMRESFWRYRRWRWVAPAPKNIPPPPPSIFASWPGSGGFRHLFFPPRLLELASGWRFPPVFSPPLPPPSPWGKLTATDSITVEGMVCKQGSIYAIWRRVRVVRYGMLRTGVSEALISVKTDSWKEEVQPSKRTNVLPGILYYCNLNEASRGRVHGVAEWLQKSNLAREGKLSKVPNLFCK